MGVQTPVNVHLVREMTSHMPGCGVVDAECWVCPRSHHGLLTIVVIEPACEKVPQGPRTMVRRVQIEGVMQHENDDA